MNLSIKYLTCIFCLITGLFTGHLAAQSGCQGLRYREQVFSCVNISSNIQYGTGLHDWPYNALCSGITQGAFPPYTTQLPLMADVYTPCNDTVTGRPLVIFIHGGGFGSGDKTGGEAVGFSDDMAKRGYVVASINYRMSMCGDNLLVFLNQMNLGDYELRRAGYRAMQDARAAIRYFKANAALWGIDTTQVFLSGGSAGAITALEAAYVDQISEKYAEANAIPSLGYWLGNLLYPDLGSLEGSGGNPGYSSRIQGLSSYAGGLLDAQAIDTSAAPPAVLFHGTADLVVPPGTGCVYQDVINAGLLTNCVDIQGSQTLYAQAQTTGLCMELYLMQGGGHEASPVEADSFLSRTAHLFADIICATPVVSVAAAQVQACPGAQAAVGVTAIGQGLSYQWYLNGSLIPGADSATHTFTAGAPTYGTYTCRVNGPGCAYAWSAAIQVSAQTPPPASIAAAGPALICPGGVRQLQATPAGGVQYAWTLDNQPIPAATSMSLTATQAGTYQVSVTDAAGCVSVSPAFVLQQAAAPTVTLSLTGPQTLCQGSTLQLDATTGATQVTWFRDQQPIPGATGLSLTVSQGGTYALTVTDANGCQATSDAAVVTVLPAATAGFTYQAAGATVTFQDAAQQAVQWSWSFGDGAVSALPAPVHTYISSGLYTVTQVVTGACGNLDTLTQAVQVTVPLALDPARGEYFVLSPNPASGEVHLTPGPGITGIWTAEIRTLTGQLMASSRVLNQEPIRWDISTWPAGVYWVSLRGDAGQLTLPLMKR
ncbi:MAG: PKD domain-containing protein [Bacteroidia bacterium]|nr:PKD domain-containing protein [Bacteroidia bacterium]